VKNYYSEKQFPPNRLNSAASDREVTQLNFLEQAKSLTTVCRHIELCILNGNMVASD